LTNTVDVVDLLCFSACDSEWYVELCTRWTWQHRRQVCLC